MRYYLVIAFITISLSSFSQSISVIGNYPLIHKPDFSGIIDVQLQLNLIETKNYNWEFGINLDYLAFKNQISNNFNLLKATISIENNIMEIGPSLGLIIVGDVGYYHENYQNGLAIGFGIVFDRMIFEKTQLLINLKENMLIDNFNYLNLGIGIRRFL
ncbi:MAG: hypothetical protein HRT58_00165 [Crocinitomicaceae bacterium]|nr:hypothetical protein [Flavobacteriales bacterium]NQZ34034.1 hypothetical protein [Crocinitomicaceae bacterium]